MGSFKGDIQATRIAASTTKRYHSSSCSIKRNYYCRINQRQVSVILKTTSATGATLFSRRCSSWRHN
jgi:hypothetical protein